LGTKPVANCAERVQKKKEEKRAGKQRSGQQIKKERNAHHPNLKTAKRGH
jgi:hypothetical protein